jgi:putative nucleotidyltransferase with HDIG domain
LLRRILFVDDEPNLLMGLQRVLHPMRSVWEMQFVSSAGEALQAVANQAFDAVVTDMRMPGMTGAELLDLIRDQSPRTVRIVLSGQSDRESILQSIAPAHQFLAKPCDPEQLKSILERALGLADLLENESLQRFISRLTCIPSLPLLFEEVTRELRSPDPSASRLGELIAQDMAMTAKLLQMVNSAVYGVRAEISEPKQAVLLLGLDTIQAMVLSLSIFSAFDPKLLGPVEAERLWEHSIAVSRFSRAIAEAEGIAGRALHPYQSAGLLHDIGKLIMAAADSKEYRRIEDIAIATAADRCQVEARLWGCTHAQVGAYLLGIWGLPEVIVEAVAWSHNPSASPVTEFSPLAAVHVASALDAQMHPEYKQADSQLDRVFLERIGLASRQELWRQRCAELAAAGRPE